MPDTAVSSLEPRWQRLYEQAVAALDRGEAQAVLDLCRVLLEQAPGCVEIRRLQLAARKQLPRGRPGFRTRLSAALLSVRFLFPPVHAPRRLALIDRVLSCAPDNGSAWAALGNLAIRLGWPDTALFALERLRELQPDEPAVLRAMMETCLEARRLAEARHWAERLCDLRPHDAQALEMLRRICVAETLATEGPADSATSAPPPTPPPPSPPG